MSHPGVKERRTFAEAQGDGHRQGRRSAGVLSNPATRSVNTTINGSEELKLVSIVVPVFNGEMYLQESLDSILAQVYPRLEVLVMDDASTDRTPEILRSYGDRVRCHRQEKNRGIYGNTNDGIARARGEYIAVYHADDIYTPDIVAREVQFLEKHPDAGAVFCSDIFIDPNGCEEGRLVLPPEVRGGAPLDFATTFNALLTYKNRFLMCPSSMVRASVYRDVGVYRDQEFRNTSDVEMWLRIAQKYRIGILEDYLFRYRFGHGNSAQRYHRLRTDQERFFEVMDLYLEQGARKVTSPDALAAYESHRAEDRLLRTINCYLLGRMDDARGILETVRAGQIWSSPVVERNRLLMLLFGLRFLVHLPKIPVVANLFEWRWYGAGKRRRGSSPAPWQRER